MNPQRNGQGASRSHRPLIVGLVAAALLFGASAGGYTRSMTKAKEATLLTNLRALNEAMSQYHADNARYPATLDTLIQDHYLRAVPEDPFTKSNSTWVPVPAEPDPNNPTAESGVYDIKSGSDGTALDGTKYSDW